MTIVALKTPPCVHGEGITFNSQQTQLYWVDIIGQKIIAYDVQQQTAESYPMPEQIGFAIPLDDQTLLCGLERGLAYFDLLTSKLSWLRGPEPELLNNRFNDAKLDSQGRLWANTMDKQAKAISGALYCCSFQGRDSVDYKRVDQGFAIGNGPTWSADSKLLYHAETEKNAIFCFDFNAVTAELSNKRLFYQHHESGMGPDGMRTDAQGCVWVAMAHGAKVLQLSVKGQLLREVQLPASFPTSLVFVDKACTKFYVTTSQLDQLDGDSLAGLTLYVDLSAEKDVDAFG